MSTVETVKLIVGQHARQLPGAEIIAPLPVWDNQQGSMGVQIKVSQDRGGQECEAVANFVLTRAELSDAVKINDKAKLVVSAILADIQVTVRLVKQEKVA